MTLTVQDLDYHLPEGMIATHPVSPRSSARLLVVGEPNRHAHVRDLAQFLPEKYLLVVNETAVVPARFSGHHKDTGGKVSGLYLNHLGASDWEVMLKSGRKFREGMTVVFGNDVELRLKQKQGSHWNCECNDTRHPTEILEDVGLTPLPPYIIKARGDAMQKDDEDRQRYQTVYADRMQSSSVAAPTAGLHFDEALLDELSGSGATIVKVTLHVGAGTFKPIECESIEDHPMHEESWFVSKESLSMLKEAKLQGIPILAVGTTSVRTLESLPEIDAWDTSSGLSGETSLMISPPYHSKLVDGILTNFHLPKSTLLALVSAYIGLEKMHQVYAEAIESSYRFYSFGDAMFIPSDH